jgi:hypothetical protein
VLDQSGQALANAAVYLSTVGSGFGPTRTEWTDDAGKFQFSNLSSGVFNVWVRVPTHYTDTPDDQPIYVRAGESIKVRMIRGGILTGKVTGPSGEPLIAAAVKPTRVRDQEGSLLKGGNTSRESQTDDRGVYRIYGLPPGSYVVSVGGGRNYGQKKPYDLNAPTYFPSSTRDTAAEVVVTAGQETSGIDIRYRDDPGYRVSGTVSGIPAAGSSGIMYWGTSVSLTSVKTGFIEANTSVSSNDSNKSFIFYGVPDGEYDLMAARGGRDEQFASPARRIVVKGSDVTGLELALAPLGKISGQVNLDPIPEGQKNLQTRAPDPPLTDTLVMVRRDGKRDPHFPSPRAVSLDDKGKFVFANLTAGLHRFELGLPSGDWYVREMISAKPDKPAEKPRGRGTAPATGQDIAARGVPVKAGEHVDGIVITLGRGAAYVAGTLAPEAGGGKLPPHVRVCLIPVEPERAEDVLAYRQVIIAGDDTFAIANVPPGKYRVLAVPGPADDSPEVRATQIAWDLAARKQLRTRAQAEGVELELAPRKRVKDLALKYRPPGDGARIGL